MEALSEPVNAEIGELGLAEGERTLKGDGVNATQPEHDFDNDNDDDAIGDGESKTVNNGGGNVGSDGPAVAVAVPVPESAAGAQQFHAGGWGTGMFDCCLDMEACWWSCWCSCLVFSRTHHSFGIVNSSRSFGLFVICILSWPAVAIFLGLGIATLHLIVSLTLLFYYRATIRTRLRETLQIQGDFCTDWIAHCCCIPCVTSQEARQAKIMGRPYADFITGENITGELVPPSPENAGIWPHMQTLSLLTRLLCGLLFVIFAISAILWHQKESSVVYVLVFVAPLVILYFTYWRSSRHELPLDVVMKLFFAGFFVATLSAIVIESVLSPIVSVVILNPKTMKRPSQQPIEQFIQEHIAQLLIYTFINGFFVAAATEEFTKYMVVNGCWLPHPLRTPKAVLIAYVAGALGFATMENVEYAFSAHPTQGLNKFESELVLLFIRSVLPVHAICAALQAHKAIQRDFEQVPTSVVQVLAPPVILHGFFDFILMFLSFVFVGYDTGLGRNGVTAVMLVIPFVIALAGFAYTWLVLRAQRDRMGQGWRRVDDGHEDAGSHSMQEVNVPAAMANA
uniref:Uncharacterized protein n=2 Tax=Lotharella globosa TaxID=91324 RepID=A0A6V3KJ78_9EUKA|mmetsp:Transcript_9902/g.19515  ORF Transcript_9902/g.19515 Transcript_9902/m.19515 type:complete len:567 (+) Transcript_9902:104-1804(+)